MAAGVGLVLAVMGLVHNPVALLLFRSSAELALLLFAVVLGCWADRSIRRKLRI